MFRWVGLAVASSYPAIVFIFTKDRALRDHPQVIKQRLILISVYACAMLGATYTLYPEVYNLIGMHFQLWSCVKVLFVTSLPLLGSIITNPPELEDVMGGQGVRNIIIGPLTEEVIYRGILGGIYKYYGAGMRDIVRDTPLYFGVAHLHHALELLAQGQQMKEVAIACSAQFIITYLFGMYAAYIWVLTGSIWPCVVAHSFCNWVGPPPLGGPTWYWFVLLSGFAAFFWVLFVSPALISE